MPIYEYRCLECQKNFETLILGSKDTVTCPYCKGNRLEKLMSSFGFRSGRSGMTESYSPSSGSSGCASCTSGSCSTCH